jgi:hypothetical protein
VGYALLEEDMMSLTVGSPHTLERNRHVYFIIFLDKRDTYCNTDPFYDRIFVH